MLNVAQISNFTRNGVDLLGGSQKSNAMSMVGSHPVPNHTGVPESYIINWP